MEFDPVYKMVKDDEMKDFFRNMNAQLNQYSASGLAKPAQNVLKMIKESHDKLVPEDTQATKNSWYQEINEKDGELQIVFGNDKSGTLDYVPFIYLGLYPDGKTPISFRKAGAEPFWLHKAYEENQDAIVREMTKRRPTKKGK